MAQNIAVTLIPTPRSGEVPDADWTGGMNYGSCNPGLGINTGDYGPKSQDWSRDEPGYYGESSVIGGVAKRVNLIQGSDVNDQTAFASADAETAPGGVIDATLNTINETGKTIPAGGWAWGRIAVT